MGTEVATKLLNCCAQIATCGSKFYSCPVGFKKRDVRATSPCAGLDASSCAEGDKCCIKDDSKCGGLDGIDCPADKYFPDSLKGAPATNANKLTTCCVVKAPCAAGTCPSGWKPKPDAAALPCPRNAASCRKETCCERDTTKCGGLLAIACAAGFYDESNGGAWPAGTKQATRDAWNNKPAIEATKNTACCTAKAACTVEARGAAAVTTTPARVAATTVTTTPVVLPALKFSEHKVAIGEGSGHPWATNMALLVVGCLIGASTLMTAQRLRYRMRPACTKMLRTTEVQAKAGEADGTLLLEGGNVE